MTACSIALMLRLGLFVGTAACRAPSSSVEIAPWQGDDLVAALVGESTVQLSADLRISVSVRDRETDVVRRRTVYVQRGATANTVTGSLEVAFESLGIGVEQDPGTPGNVDVLRRSRLAFDTRYEVVSVQLGPLADHDGGSRELELTVEYR